MEIKSILIKDTTREERICIVQEGLNQCGGVCDFCNVCDNLGGGSVDAFYEPYINGEKELRTLHGISWKRPGTCLCRLYQWKAKLFRGIPGISIKETWRNKRVK